MSMKKIKFSLIVPVYNSEKYLKRCLDSIYNQTYSNFEVIVVNDGSTDNSEKIIKDYSNIKYIKQQNAGVSVARNVGISKVKGDYFLFVDSDDTVESDLLERLNEIISNEDGIRYQLRIIDSNTNEYKEASFTNYNGGKAFKEICKYKYIDLNCLYAFKTSYWKDNNFKFKEGCYHEDFGLIPEVIFKANSVTSIDYCGYNYYQNDNSIMNTTDYNKIIKKAFDVLDLGISEINNIEKYNKYYEYKAIFNSFIANSIFIKLNSLKGKDKEKYISIIKNNNIINYLLNNTFKRKLKKRFYMIKYKL